jgi:hypothetical protein
MSIINFTTIWDSDYWMNSNGMYCGFNMPPALNSLEVGDNEGFHGLPPYEKRKFYLADEYPAVPKNWVPSEGRKTSYFVPVKEGHGLWLDFNKNNQHKYEVAIVVSIQGINPITGMPCVDAGLEQYIDQCPKHKIAFGPNRYCEKCDYKWPKQNYICTTGTPDGNLWLDGFRTADGIVRQYILTMDKIKGVAANIIKEERVFAIGISFFLSVNPKPFKKQPSCRRSLGIYNQCATKGGSLGGYSGGSASSAIYAQPNFFAPTTTTNTKDDMFENKFNRKCFVTCDTIADFPAAAAAAAAAEASTEYSGSFACSSHKTDKIKSFNAGNLKQCSVQSVNVKKVEVGAGANVRQMIHEDPEPLDFWRKEPESVILINYALEESCLEIISKGKISLEGHKESFLKDIPVGNEKK